MRRFIRVMVVMFLLVVIGATATPFFVPVDSIKAALQGRLEVATGRKVSLGKMRFSVFPDIALTVQDIAIGNPPGAGDGDFATIKTLRVGLELMPLVHKELRLKELTLESPTITLLKRAGQANWRMAGAIQAPDISARPSRRISAGSAAHWYLGKITIKNGVLTYRDAARPNPQTLTDINLSITAPEPLQPGRLEGSAVYKGSKADIEATLASPRDFIGGKPSDADIKAKYGSFDITWKGALGLPQDDKTALLSGALGIREIDTAALSEPAQAATTGTVSGTTAGPTVAGDKAPWSDDPLQLGALGSVEADITLTIGKLILSRTTLSDIRAKVKLHKGLLSLVTEKLHAYDGTAEIALLANSANNISFSSIVSDVKAEPLLHDLAHQDAVAGTLSAHFSGLTGGVSERAMVSALKGQGDFSLKDGSLRGLNLAAMARNIASAFQTSSDQKSTDFSELSGSFTIANGVVSNTDMKLNSPLLMVTGAGTADLPRWQVNYVLKPTVAASLEGQGGSPISGIVVPITVTGPLNAPQYKPDLNAAIAENLGTDPGKLKENVKKLKKKLLTGGKLNTDALKGLLR